MKRRQFIHALALASAGGALAARAQETAQPTRTLVRTPLSLMAPRTDGIEAIWAVNQLSKGRVEWEADDGSTGVAARDEFGFVPQGSEVIRVRVDGLKPGRRYRLRSITVAAADGKEEVSPWKSFRTLNADATATEFVVWNDTHIHNQTIQKLHEATPAADFLVWNGDTCNDWTARELLVPTILHPGERDITDGRPLLLTWGNHDVRGPHAFELPRLIATPGNRPYYAFRSGPVAAICLHTGEDKPDDHPSFRGRVAFEALRREQAEWLADIIREPGFRDAPFRIVFCHIPLRWTNEEEPDYARGGFDHFSSRSRNAWHRALVDWKTQLVISGHTHRNALIPPNEQFPYRQITGGGPQPERATWMRAKATSNEFKLEVNDLSGVVRHTVELRPLV